MPLDRITDFELEMEEDTQKGKYLTFRVGTERYGMEIHHVTELIQVLPITPMPNLPADIRGVISLRGKIIPVMDVRIRFGKTAVESNDKTCIIIMEIGEQPLGLLVDRVEEVVSIPEEKIVPPPEMVAGSGRYVQGIGKSGDHVVLILDCSKLAA